MTKAERPGLAIVTMGVSGCGKSSLGAALAKALGLAFVEGDALHPLANIEKMSAGVPLTDEDRWPWLDGVAHEISTHRAFGVVASCSALRRSYRDRLRAKANGPLIFLHLHGELRILSERLATRAGHFMPPGLLSSQHDALELPHREAGTFTIDVALSPKMQLREAFRALKGQCDSLPSDRG